MLTISFSTIEFKPNHIEIINVTDNEIIDGLEFEFEPVLKNKEIKKTKVEKEVKLIKGGTKIVEIDKKTYKIKDKVKLKKDYDTKENKNKLKSVPLYIYENYCVKGKENCTNKLKKVKDLDLTKSNIELELEDNTYYKIGENSITFLTGNIIKIMGNSTHGTESNPYTLNDVYEADIANGWNCIDKYNDFQYWINSTKCHMQIGGNDTYHTYFEIKEAQITLDLAGQTSSGIKSFIEFGQYSHITLGELTQGATDETGYGVSIMVINDALFYSLIFTPKTGDNDCLESVWNGSQTVYWLTCEIEMYGVQFTQANRYTSYTPDQLIGLHRLDNLTMYSIYMDGNIHIATTPEWQFNPTKNEHKNQLLMNSIKLRRPQNGVYESLNTIGGAYYMRDTSWGANVTIVDFKGRGVVSYFQYFTSIPNNSELTWLNADIDKYTTWIKGSVNPNGFRSYMKYTFDLGVYDYNNSPLANATISLIQNNGDIALSTTTDINGTVPQQNLTWGYWENTYYPNNVIVDENNLTTNITSPYTLIIEKDGYVSYNYTWTPRNKMDWSIRLQNSTTEEDFIVGYSLGKSYTKIYIILILFILIGMVVTMTYRYNEA